MFMSGGSRGIGLEIAKRAAADGAQRRADGQDRPAAPQAGGHGPHRGGGDRGGRRPGAADRRRRPLTRTRWPAAVAQTVDRFGGHRHRRQQRQRDQPRPSPTSMSSATTSCRTSTPAARSCDAAACPTCARPTTRMCSRCRPPLTTDPNWLRGHRLHAVEDGHDACSRSAWPPTRREHGVAANCLWPRTMIATAAVQNLLGGDETMARCRDPEICADAAHAILSLDPRGCTGNAFIDDEVLAEAGVTDLRVRGRRAPSFSSTCSSRTGAPSPRPERRRRGSAVAAP